MILNWGLEKQRSVPGEKGYNRTHRCEVRSSVWHRWGGGSEELLEGFKMESVPVRLVFKIKVPSECLLHNGQFPL